MYSIPIGIAELSAAELEERECSTHTVFTLGLLDR